MKTTTEILNELVKEDGYDFFNNLCQKLSFSYLEENFIRTAMLRFAEHTRNEDRKLIAKHVKMTGIAYGNDTSITDYEVDLDSIINCEKLKLK